jgi:flagellar basal-body rod modification protein FlgD
MAISGVSSTTTIPNNTASSTSLGGSDPQAVQDRFMTLLIEQLKNQDPLNPMDNAQMTSQMSQISMVSGIQQLNQSMSSLTQSMLSTQSSQAVSLIGKNVAVAGNNLALTSNSNGSNQANGAMWLASDADSATVTIQDMNGNTVKTLPLQNLKAGLQTFNWDGTSDNGSAAPSGSYKVAIQATQGSTAVTANALQWGTVNGVQQDSTGGWSVLINGNNTPVSVSNVRSVSAS